VANYAAVRADLMATEPHWKGWFTGLSKQFLSGEQGFWSSGTSAGVCRRLLCELSEPEFIRMLTNAALFCTTAADSPRGEATDRCRHGPPGHGAADRTDAGKVQLEGPRVHRALRAGERDQCDMRLHGLRACCRPLAVSLFIVSLVSRGQEDKPVETAAILAEFARFNKFGVPIVPFKPMAKKPAAAVAAAAVGVGAAPGTSAASGSAAAATALFGEQQPSHGSLAHQAGSNEPEKKGS
jgi:hypothetical protein